MKKFLLLFVAACAQIQRPGDMLGPGTMCQPQSDYVQRCSNAKAKYFRCVDSGGKWTCIPE